MEDADRAAIAATRAGNPEAFRALVERHGRGVFRLAYRMLGNRQDAEDVSQEAFFRAYRQLRQFDERAGFSTWLHRIAANCALDLLRARARRRETEPPALETRVDKPGPDRLALTAQLQQKLVSALDDLTAMERTAFLLRHWEGLPVEEISRVLGRNSTATRHCIFRAVRKLRRVLRPMVTSVL